MSAVHASPYSGSWYPRDAGGLQRLLAGCWERSARRTGPLPGGALGYVVPHAGPQYSGAVAASVYRSIEIQQPDRIVVLAFPHRGGLQGVAAPDAAAISTPLGTIALDAGFLSAFPRVPEERVCDHSFEIQLPFLQKAAPHARVSVLYVGRLSGDGRRAAAAQLAEAARAGAVLVASSDFTHYGPSFGFLPFPLDRDTARRLRELDAECASASGSGDAALFLDTLEETGATVCGSGPIGLMLETLRLIAGDDLYQVQLDYETSGEIAGDYRDSVSYAALGYFRREAFRVSSAEGETLLALASEALQNLRETGDRASHPAAAPLSPTLQMRRGAFVTLSLGDELLGCVGNVTGCRPLSEEIVDLTLSAALDDPRFRPAAEVEGPIDIEISVLTPLRRIRDAAEIKIGCHGVFLRVGGHSGLLLPQVATEHGWNAEEFLRALSRKSLTAPHSWRDPRARLYVFEAQILKMGAGGQGAG